MSDALGIVLHNKFTEQQARFIQGIISGLDIKAATVQAGYSEATAPQIAHVLLKQPQILAAIQIGIARELSLGAPSAIKLLRRFVEEDKWDAKVRLAAANSILNRAGHIAPKAVDASKGGETPLNEMSMTELRDLADKLEGEIAGRAKEVSSAKPAPPASQAIDDII